MELKQLQYFVVSVDMGSFQNAAKMLYTTQPHVSKTVKALEEELHLKLLNREARGVKMTAEGKKVYDYATLILKNTDQPPLRIHYAGCAYCGAVRRILWRTKR